MGKQDKGADAPKLIRVGVRTKHNTQHGDHAFPYACAGHRFHSKETQVEVTEEELAELRSKSHALLVRVLDGSAPALPTAEEIVAQEKVIDALRADIDKLARENTNLRAQLAAYKDPEDESDAGPVHPAPPLARPPAGVPKMG